MSLKDYKRKRDFKKTPEPGGNRSSKANKHRFVIQKHAASRLHYDFRLEMEGTLKSWAVPRGFPYAKGEKRLAVQVEDHPISYIDFEGVIPKGQYGGGTVMVWDQGSYATLSPSPAKSLAAGKLHFILSGQKLQGEWYLVRLRERKEWLLIRGNNDMRPVSKKKDDMSALSGKSMKELSAGNHIWQSSGTNNKSRKTSALKTQPELPLPIKFIEPMKARLVTAPPAGEWIYEIKFDGYRALALKSGGHVQLLSRNQKDFAKKFPELTDGIARISAKDAIIDGEIVALTPTGQSSFQLLQAHDLGLNRPPIFFYAFDLLRLNGVDLRNEPLVVRKTLLEKLLKKAPEVIRFSASLKGKIGVLLERARRLGLEGLIGKRKDSHYEAGSRTGAWIKLKLGHHQELVIGGFTDPEGQRRGFGALLVGYYAKGHLRFAGKVGTGFSEKLLDRLHGRLKKLSISDCPFVNLPEKNSQGLTAARMRRCHWVKPSLLCQVRFAEWTRDGKLRQPAFLGLREDKDAKKVIRESPG